MTGFNQIERGRRTAIYIRISTSQQQTDRQESELKDFARRNGLNFIEETDMYIDIISGFKEGDARPQYSILKNKVEAGLYQQILFSEFSRLDRKPSNLLKSIEYYQSKNVWLWFGKQQMWVRDKSDISTQIMISVLAVMSQYEIELLTARGLDGKISAIKAHGIHIGGFTPYGYSDNPVDHRLVVNPAEAEIVRRIFKMLIADKTSYDIATILNAEGISCPFRTRFLESMERRRAKGLPEKKYRRCETPEELVWTTATINRIARNAIYIGKRHSTFHEPDPSNPLPAYKRKERRVYLEMSLEQESLRIVDDETFNQVGKILDERMFNKNGGIRHDNLLKHLLRCGECGSRFTSASCSFGRSYKCSGKISTAKRPRICFLGADVMMYKLDGLVIQLCIRKFTGYDLRQKAMGKIMELEGEIESKRSLQQAYRDSAIELHENYSAVMKRIIKFAKDDTEAENWIAAERSEYERKCEENRKVIETLKNDITSLNRRRTSLLKVEDKPEFANRQAEILMDRSLVKEYINEYIQDIVLYKPSDLWALVIIHFVDGSERWGTIKNAKYRKGQTGQELKYTGWFIDNDDHLFSYDRETHSITEKITSLVYKTYTFEEFGDIASARGWTGEFGAYEF